MIFYGFVRMFKTKLDNDTDGTQLVDDFDRVSLLKKKRVLMVKIIYILKRGRISRMET